MTLQNHVVHIEGADAARTTASKWSVRRLGLSLSAAVLLLVGAVLLVQHLSVAAPSSNAAPAVHATASAAGRRLLTFTQPEELEVAQAIRDDFDLDLVNAQHGYDWSVGSNNHLVTINVKNLMADVVDFYYSVAGSETRLEANAVDYTVSINCDGARQGRVIYINNRMGPSPAYRDITVNTCRTVSGAQPVVTIKDGEVARFQCFAGRSAPVCPSEFSFEAGLENAMSRETIIEDNAAAVSNSLSKYATHNELMSYALDTELDTKADSSVLSSYITVGGAVNLDVLSKYLTTTEADETYTDGSELSSAIDNRLDAAISGLVTSSVTNGLVDSSVTSGLVTADQITGFVTSSVTNGLVGESATSGLVTSSVTNGLVDSSVTSGLVTSDQITGFVTSSVTNGLVGASATSGLVTSSVTNGLVTSSATSGLVTSSATSGLVTSSVTNGLVGSSATSGLVSSTTLASYATQSALNQKADSSVLSAYISSETSGQVTSVTFSALSRTVQDNYLAVGPLITENVDNKLGNIFTSISGLNTDRNNLRGSVRDLQPSVNSLKTLSSSVVQLKTSVTNLVPSVTALGSSVTAIGSSVTAVGSSVTSLDTSIKKVYSKANSVYGAGYYA